MEQKYNELLAEYNTFRINASNEIMSYIDSTDKFVRDICDDLAINETTIKAHEKK